MEALEGVLEFLAVPCRDVQVNDLEVITIFQIGGDAGIQVQLIWKDISGIENEVTLRHGDGIFPVLVNLVPVILITIVPLQVRWIMFVVEYTTPYMLENLGVTDIRQSRWYHLWYHEWITPHTYGGGSWLHWKYLVVNP